MTSAAKAFNEKYNLNISDASFKEVKKNDQYNDLISKPQKNITQTMKRLFTSPWTVVCLVIFVAIVLMSIIIPITSQYDPDQNISFGKHAALVDTKNLNHTGIVTDWVDEVKFDKIKNQTPKINYEILAIHNGQYQIKWDPYDLISSMDGIKHNAIIGTDSLGRDIWTRTWAGTWSSLKLAFLVVAITTTIGTLLGSWVGLYVGTLVDILFMKIIAIYNSIPTIIWYTLILFILPKGQFALITIFVVTGWMAGMGTARMYMWKYVNSDFMKAAEVTGVSMFGRIVRHALPNYIGIVAIGFVSSIPMIIEAEASLAFLGFSPSPNDASLGNVLNEAQKAVRGAGNIAYLLVPTFIIFTITISLKYVALGINDAVDPKFAKRR